MKYNFDKPIDRTNTNSKKWNSEIYKVTMVIQIYFHFG